MSHFLFLDIESTGLSPIDDDIWEVAAIITDNEFKEQDIYHSYVRYPDLNGLYRLDDYLEDFEKYNHFVHNMHTTSGLLEKWIAAQHTGARTINEVQDDLTVFVAPYLNDVNMITLAGSSVHYDHMFLAEKMPHFNQLLFHGHLDTSSCKQMINTISKNMSDKFRDDQGIKHLAMDDIMNDIRWAKNFRDYLIREMVELFQTNSSSPSSTNPTSQSDT